MSSTTADSRIPASINQRLKKLRAAIGRFLWIDGLSKVLALVVLLVLVDLGIDRIFKMDLAQRGIMLAVMAALVLGAIYYCLIRPLSKKVTDDALLLQVEGKHRELRQSVISAAQLARGSNYEEQGVSQSMVEATIRRGGQMAEAIRFGSAIDTAAFFRNLVLLLGAVVALGGVSWGVANSGFWSTWFNRNILLSSDQWPRQTTLVIENAEAGVLSLLRGEDHKQVVRVSEASQVKTVDVTIEFDDGNVRSRQKMRRTGELEHTIVFRNLGNEFQFRAIGGDHTTDWVNVSLVDAPNWSDLSMRVEMPEYTSVQPYELPEGGGPHAILEGSSLTISGTANKPLTSAALKVGDQKTWEMVPGEAGQWQARIPAADLIGGRYAFDLTDEFKLRSSRPTTFSLKVKADRPPVVRATLLGISGLVVPKARIPIQYSVDDEFKVANMHLEHAWTGNSNTATPNLGRVELTTLDPELAVQIGQNEIQGVAVVDMEPMNIPVDVSLRLTISADDNNTLTGPGTGKSREFLLRVVSEEELRADLLRREIEQRKAFELVLGNQEKLMFDLQAISDALTAADLPFTPEEVSDQLRDAQRRQKLVGTNVARVADRFEEFLVEAINNRLDEAETAIERGQSIEVRFNERIIQPIRELDSSQIITAGQLIELAGRDVVYDPDNNAKTIAVDALSESLKNATAMQTQVIETMRNILASMKDSETYQEVVNKVIEIKRTEESIRDKAREKRDEVGGGDIFDDDEDMFDDEDGSSSEDGQDKGN